MCTAVSSGAANERGIGERRVDRARLRLCRTVVTANPTAALACPTAVSAAGYALEGCQVLVTRAKPHIGCFGEPLAASEVLPNGCTLGEILAALSS